MVYSISYAELESLSTQTLRHFATKIISELERRGTLAPRANTRFHPPHPANTRIAKQPKPRGPGL